MIKKLNSNQKGFTLIELMIVIAIIGILAAIAIPQFAAYRIRGFNSSAQSDVRNLSTSEAALFSDWQMFGGSDAIPVANPLVFAPFGGGGGVPLYGPTGILNTPNVVPCIEVTAQLGDRGIQIPLGNNVELVASTEGAANASFVGETKHFNGNTTYGVDSDITAVYFDEWPGSDGKAAVFAVASTVQFDNFQNQAGPSGKIWAVR